MYDLELSRRLSLTKFSRATSPQSSGRYIYDTDGNSCLVWKSQGLPPRQIPRQRKHNPRYSFKAPFTISSNAFRTQEWSNIARDDVWRLRKIPPLVSFLVGWLVQPLQYPEDEDGDGPRNIGFFATWRGWYTEKILLNPVNVWLTVCTNCVLKQSAQKNILT
jgi:hypothetical protein